MINNHIQAYKKNFRQIKFKRIYLSEKMIQASGNSENQKRFRELFFFRRVSSELLSADTEVK